MKVEQGNLKHRWWLVRSALHVALAILARPFRRRNAKPVVLLYGHKLGGNLLALYEGLVASGDGWDVAFLTLDPDYKRELEGKGVRVICASYSEGIGALVRADAVVAQHGLHTLEGLLRASDLRFFDVWHGIPFKGFLAEEFDVQHQYEETWVTSPLLQRMYVEKFGFAPEQVQVTGYARTDRLVRRDDDVAAIRRRIGVPESGRCVLFAPTWKQDAQQRSLYPFDIPADEFLAALSALCERHDATMIMRSHINSGNDAPPAFPRIVHVPYAREPDTEGILLASDLLVCDWSSIAFDYLLLERPALFLDVPAPFKNGFSLGPEYRFGAIVGDGQAMLDTLDRYLADDNAYRREVGDKPAQVRNAVYGEFADGQATARCIARLRAALG